MNRAERRRLQKQGISVEKPAVFSMKKDIFEENLQEMYKKGYEKAQEKSNRDAVDEVLMMLALPLKVLQDKYGWGTKKRLPEFAEYLIEEFEYFGKTDMSLQDLCEYIFETTGFKFMMEEQ